MTSLITVQDLRNAALNAELHVRVGGGGYMLQYRCAAWPDWTVTKSCQGAGQQETCDMRVGDERCPDMDAVAAAINRRAALRGLPAEAAS